MMQPCSNITDMGQITKISLAMAKEEQKKAGINFDS